MATGPEPFGLVADRAAYLPEADALVLADLHLGRAATAPVHAPLNEGPAILDRLGRQLDGFDPATVVLAGDVLHAADQVPREARETFVALRSAVEDHGATLRVVAGNHDRELAAIDDASPVDAVELADGTVVCHGHEPPASTGRRYVVGHDHPAIVIEGRRRPCALYGPAAYDGADVLALPAYNPGVPGTPVNRLADGDALSPLLEALSRFHPVVWDPDAAAPLVFPALAALQPYL